MPVWTAYLFLSLTVVLAIVLIVVWRGSTTRIAEAKRELGLERDRANAGASAQAQLIVVQQSLKDAEARAQQLQSDLTGAAARAAGLQSAMQAADSRVEEARQEALRAQEAFTTANGEAQALRETGATLSAERDAALNSTRDLAERLNKAERDRDEAIEARRLLTIELKGMEADRDKAIELARQATEFVENAREQMRATFAEAASKVFDEKAVTLEQRINQSSEASKKSLEETLKPFNENLKTFRERVDTLNESQVKDNANLVGQIRELKTLNQNMAETTDSLTRALKGSAKVRGNWGEMILESVLKACGLEEGTTFLRQSSSTDEESGKRKQPDVVLVLPDDRQVVIDSKVNLLAWADAHETDDPVEYHACLQRHAAALRLHVRDLAEKNYPKTLGEKALGITILFVPIEGALSAAIASDPRLQMDAWKQGITFASPNTLMPMLNVIERLWMRERLQRQIDVISKGASNLMDSITAFVGEFNSIETKLSAAQGAVADAKRRLSDGTQSVYARAKRLAQAGAKGNKLLPAEVTPDDAAPTLALVSGANADDGDLG